MLTTSPRRARLSVLLLTANLIILVPCSCDGTSVGVSVTEPGDLWNVTQKLQEHLEAGYLNPNFNASTHLSTASSEEQLAPIYDGEYMDTVNRSLESRRYMDGGVETWQDRRDLGDKKIFSESEGRKDPWVNGGIDFLTPTKDPYIPLETKQTKPQKKKSSSSSSSSKSKKKFLIELSSLSTQKTAVATTEGGGAAVSTMMSSSTASNIEERMIRKRTDTPLNTRLNLLPWRTRKRSGMKNHYHHHQHHHLDKEMASTSTSGSKPKKTSSSSSSKKKSSSSNKKSSSSKDGEGTAVLYLNEDFSVDNTPAAKTRPINLGDRVQRIMSLGYTETEAMEALESQNNNMDYAFDRAGELATPGGVAACLDANHCFEEDEATVIAGVKLEADAAKIK